jgi:hypothetical protein
MESDILTYIKRVKKICRKVLGVAPKCYGTAYYLLDYKLGNGLLMDVSYYPPNLTRYGVFVIAYGPEATFSDDPVYLWPKNFDEFERNLKKVLADNAK